MMKKYSDLIMIFLFLSLLSACSDSDWHQVEGVSTKYPIKLMGEIEQVYQSRVNDGGFCHLDKIGVYVVDYKGDAPGALQNEGNRATNLEIVYHEDKAAWIAADDIYFKDDKTAVDIYGYYPYRAEVDVDDFTFEVSAHQNLSGRENRMGEYEASDFLWSKAEGIAPTESSILLGFQHRMANVRVSLLEGDGFASDEWAGLDKSVLVANTKREAIIDLTAGSVAPSGEVSEVDITPAKDGEDWRAIVVPQQMAANVVLLKITVGGVNYQFKKSQAIEFVGGKMHSFTIKVNKKEVTGDYDFQLVSEAITPWEDDRVSHDVNAREYVEIASKAGELEQCIREAGKDPAKLQNLKITGTMNANDFFFMRDQMPELEALNLKEVTIEGHVIPNMAGGNYPKDAIPQGAFSYKESLKFLILPDKLAEIANSAFSYSGLQGSLIIPEGVKKIGSYAFSNCSSLTGRLSLPSTLEEIGNNAFNSCAFNSELYLPSKLKKIGQSAFNACSGLRGNLILPEGLTELGGNAFYQCKMLTGSLAIPLGVTEIKDLTFSGCGFNGTLTLHDGITLIGNAAFLETRFKGELILPEQLTKLGWRAFANTSFSGKLKLPESLSVMEYGVFGGCSLLSDTLVIPESLEVLNNTVFQNCSSIEALVFPATLQTVFPNAFENCFGLSSIVCQGNYPAQLQSGVFNGVPKDNFSVEVPGNAVSAYQSASGWSEFKRITAHHELVCRPAFACALNKELSTTLIVDAEGEWSVKSMPDWCTLSQTSGNQKTQVTLTIGELSKGGNDRQGEIVFELTGKAYTATCAVSQRNYEYEEDQIITLQEHKVGKGVNLVFLGDGYDAEKIADGTYLKDMKQQMEYFFGVPPYSTYRDYFQVYTGIALSQEKGTGTLNTICYNKFGTTHMSESVELKGDDHLIFDYACKAPTVDWNNLNQTLIVMTPYSTTYGGTAWMYSNGEAIAYCPMSHDAYPFDARGIVQHEAGGHGFGKLADEYIYKNEFIPDEEVEKLLKWQQKYGFYWNVSVSGKMSDVRWNHLIFHEKYSGVVDIFEGAKEYTRGVFRAEHNSCMNNNIPYFNTYSRELIVRRIMEYAGEPFSFADFVAKDVMEPGEGASAATRTLDVPIWQRSLYHYPPVLIEGSPFPLNRKM